MLVHRKKVRQLLVGQTVRLVMRITSWRQTTNFPREEIEGVFGIIIFAFHLSQSTTT